MRFWWLIVFAALLFCTSCDTYSPAGNNQQEARFVRQRTVTETEVWIERLDERPTKEDGWPW